MCKRIFLSGLVLFFFTEIVEPRDHENSPVPGEAIPPYLYVNARWVDSLLQVMTPDERIGQLFMVAAFSRADTDQSKTVDLIREYHIGGLIFMQGGPVRQAQLTNYFQSISAVPLFIAQDAEWGLSMRLDSTIRFPRQLMLGAIQDDELIYEFGREMARECKRIGVNVSFSPVVDVNSNPLNPVIGERSFGEDKFNVASKGINYMKGLQDGGVLACAKHFPGHGDTEEDSHNTLPVVHSTRAQLDSLELYPFRKLIAAGVGSVMVAHLQIPALDTSSRLPSTLSKKIVTGLLKVDLGFKGLSFTDALNMKGVTNYFSRGEVDVKALLAGNDVLLYSGDVSLAISRIKEAMVRGEITQDEIDARVRKILQAKYWMGLSVKHPVNSAELYEDLNNEAALFLKQRLVEKALTLVKNHDGLIPLQRIDTFQLASVAIGTDDITPFQKMLSHYGAFQHFQIRKDAPENDFVALLDQLKNCDVVFVALGGMSRLPSNNFGVTSKSREFIQKLQGQCKVILTVFGSPYALKYFEKTPWLLEAYNDDEVIQRMSAQLLFGGIEALGKLPVSASVNLVKGQGIITNKSLRVKYTMAEDAGISIEKLKAIDTLANMAIDQHAIPGCQVWVAKDGKVIWEKSYGRFTYDVNQRVADEDLYDLASVTKIAATTMMVMKLYEEGKIDLDQTVSHYLPEFKNTDKHEIKVHQLLTHEAGFKPWIPFYKGTLDTAGNLQAEIYRRSKEGLYTIPVTEDIFMNRNYLDTIWKQIVTTPLQTPGKYVYSDLDFYVLKKIAETVTGESLDQFVSEHFYTPMGLTHLCFNPLSRFPKEDIVPSNFDYTFRKELLQGTVHDQGAAMEGGVAGHAGLFSNANDVGTMMQMLLNYGQYAGTRYLDSSTIVRFTSRYSMTCRRGLGFDKPETDKSKPSPACKSTSPSAYGHQGFTGTCVWTDPEYHLVYVFLSNRTFPDDQNSRLGDLETRIKIQQVIYDAIMAAD